MPLANKYRPQNYEELAGNEHQIKAIKRLVERGHRDGYPNFLFIGPPGSGKSSVAKVIGNEIRKYHSVKGRQGNPFVDIYNASDDRKISFIRDLKRKYEYPFPATIILDEADNLTGDAQDAFRAMLENKPDYMCNILVGNDATKFSDPIKSRCIVFHFDPLTQEDIIKRLQQIIEGEKLEILTQRDFLTQISLKVYGDMRWAINELEKIITLDHTITDASCEILFDHYYGGEYDVDILGS